MWCTIIRRDRAMLADRAGRWQVALTWAMLAIAAMKLWWKAHTVLADGLLAAGQAEGIDGELAADRAAELDRDVVLRERTDQS